MSEHDQDLVVQRAIQELRRLPVVRSDVVASVAQAAMAARADEPVVEMRRPRATGLRRAMPYVGIAVAAGVVGFLVRGAQPASRHPASPAPSAKNALTPAAMAVSAGADADTRPIASEFEFRSRAAHRVALVGDFNDWNPAATPLVRADGSGIWAVTVPVAPGRHMYAFVVDDSLFTLDPRAPAQRDRDLGTTASVVVVGRR